jgi:hypothetical protein
MAKRKEQDERTRIHENAEMEAEIENLQRTLEVQMRLTQRTLEERERERAQDAERAEEAQERERKRSIMAKIVTRMRNSELQLLASALTSWSQALRSQKEEAQTQAIRSNKLKPQPVLDKVTANVLRAAGRDLHEAQAQIAELQQSVRDLKAQNQILLLAQIQQKRETEARDASLTDEIKASKEEMSHWKLMLDAEQSKAQQLQQLALEHQQQLEEQFQHVQTIQSTVAQLRSEAQMYPSCAPSRTQAQQQQAMQQQQQQQQHAMQHALQQQQQLAISQQLQQQIQAQQEATRRWERAATQHATREQAAKQALAATQRQVQRICCL